MKINFLRIQSISIGLMAFFALNILLLSSFTNEKRECVSEYEVQTLTDTIPDKENIVIVDRSPRFPGCENIFYSKEKKEHCAQKKLLEYIYGNLTYPEEAIKNDTEGKVIITFIIEKDGSISEMELVQDVPDGCGQAALNVVESMSNLPKKWTPGKHEGKLVRVSYSLPVKFKLTD
jgi:protein TonB